VLAEKVVEDKDNLTITWYIRKGVKFHDGSDLTADVVRWNFQIIIDAKALPYINYFKDFIETKYGLKVVVGTHPIPEKYYLTHTKLKTWNTQEWDELIKPTLKDREIRLAYD